MDEVVEYATRCPVDGSVVPMGPRVHRTPYPEETDRERADRKVREADEFDCEHGQGDHKHTLLQRVIPPWTEVTG